MHQNRKRRTLRPIIKNADWHADDERIAKDITLEDVLRLCIEKRIAEKIIKHSSFENRRLTMIEDKGGDNQGITASLALYEPGKNVRTITRDEATEKTVLDSRPLVQKKGKKSELLDADLYFCLKGNRLAICQSQRLKTARLQDHFNILLQALYKNFKGLLVLKDEIPGIVAEMINLHGVQQIEFNSYLSKEMAAIGSDEEAVEIINGFFGSRLRKDKKGSMASRLREGFGKLDCSGLKTKVSVQMCKNSGSDAQGLVNAMALAMSDDMDGLAFLLNNDELITQEKLVTKKQFKMEYINGEPVLTMMYSGLRRAVSAKENEMVATHLGEEHDTTIDDSNGDVLVASHG